MKTCFAIITILIFSFGNVDGKIKNGYGDQIQDAKVSLNSLDSLKENANSSSVQSRKIKSAMRSLNIYIKYYELTEKLLEQFKTISPELFNEIDTITDNKGRPVDTFIKFIPRDQAAIRRPGTTTFAQGLNDSDAHHSEYGSGSISVKIWAMDNALFVLSHELGHVKYIAPNLASYARYYKKNYYGSDTKHNYIGHRGSDLSGKIASAFEKKFFNDYRKYIRNGSERFQTCDRTRRRGIAKDQYRKVCTLLTRSFHFDILRQQNKVNTMFFLNILNNANTIETA